MKTLKDVFDELRVQNHLMSGEVLSVDEILGGIRINLSYNRPCAQEEIAEIQEEICRNYGLQTAEINIINTEKAPVLQENEAFSAQTVTDFLSAKFPSLGWALKGEHAELAQNQLNLKVEGVSDIGVLEPFFKRMEDEVFKEFGKRIEITASLQGAVSFDEMRETFIKKSVKEAASNPAPRPVEKNTPAVSYKKKAQKCEKYNPKEASNVIFGKPAAVKIMKIGDILSDSGKVSVEGEVFFVDKRKLNGRDSTIFFFDIYDGTGAIRINKFFPDEEATELARHIKKGDWLTVQGQVTYSHFDREDNINPSAIIKSTRPTRADKAEKKRVELHFHTNMSALDALCDTKKSIDLALELGHTALAITDHGVAQAFPGAMMAAAKKPIKILYGVEAYCQNDIAAATVVKGEAWGRIDDEIVVFDLETTGFSPQKCEIIEIAAAIVKGGEIKSEFHTHVNPNTLIPPEITKLTGIENATVKDAPQLSEAFTAFLDFCQNRPLCAHNADFDMSFVKSACSKLNISRSFCSIDTLALSRAVMPELPKHKLDSLAAAFGLKFNHHRAQDDTRVLVEIFMNLLQKLRDRVPFENLDELNGAVDAFAAGGKGVKAAGSHHLIIIAKNEKGLKALYKLISDSHLYNFRRHPIMKLSSILKVREDLILGSACEAGELYTSVLAKKSDSELKKIAKNFDFLEIQPIGNNSFLIRNGMVKDEAELKDLNRRIVNLGQSLNIPVCATCDVHFLNKEDALFREIIQTGQGYSDASFQAPLYYRTTEEMLTEFAYLGKDKAMEVVVTNTNLIADMCEPIVPIPAGTFPPAIEGSAKDIEEMARSKAEKLYGVDGKLPQIVADRLEAELTPIIKNGYDVMYIIAQKLVKRSEESGYIVGSRGSVGSSLVAYLTDITEVNALAPHYRCNGCNYSEIDQTGQYHTGVDMPDKSCPNCGERLLKEGFNIPFATFLGFDADKQPDIDLNFSGIYQANAHKHTIELFGEDKVFRAGTISSIQEKTAFGYVRKYLEGRGEFLGKAEENRLVQGCTGIKRTTGQHPGGLIVVPQDKEIYDFCPVQRPADDVGSDVITTHFDYNAIHENLLKLDLLGHDDPTMLRYLADITRIDPQTIPLDDKDTMGIFTDISPLKIEGDDILEQTGAAGVPEFGTKFVRGMLTETQPKTFDGLLRISGLSHGTNVWRNNAQDLVRAKTANLGQLICARDDITIYLVEVGIDPKLAFTISESVRKGRGLKPDWEKEMQNKKVPEWYIKSCKKIEYMFPRAHAVAYVMMAFRIAWFKVHRPLEFYSAYFSIRATGFDATTMIFGDDRVTSEYRRIKAMEKRTAMDDSTLITLEVVHEFYKRGFSFAPLDIYKSQISGFPIEDGALRPPLTSVPGLGDTAAQSIAKAREDGPFSSIEDMKLRCDKLNDTLAQKLSEVGALGDLPKSEQLSLFDM